MITNDKMWMDSTEIVQSDRINQQGKINTLETIMNLSGMANIHITKNTYNSILDKHEKLYSFLSLVTKD